MDRKSSASSRGGVSLLVPEWIRAYQKDWVAPDVVAGLTAGAVVIPKALAYATVAGLPIRVGLYTAFLPMVIYAILGTSRPLSVHWLPRRWRWAQCCCSDRLSQRCRTPRWLPWSLCTRSD